MLDHSFMKKFTRDLQKVLATELKDYFSRADTFSGPVFDLLSSFFYSVTRILLRISYFARKVRVLIDEYYVMKMYW